ncbi:hypothetical protein BaRGS_00007115 [Batillaria attramentaria]|uniref:Uncharacterized protein n=1 Tax=Batillaria attramentaria TaxID=370345 RepID=A0ABD0LRQ0_9CAEN
MRPQLRTSSDQRRRSSTCLHGEPGVSLLDAAKRRGSYTPAVNGQFLAVPDLKYRRSSLSTSTSALLGMSEGTRKRGSFTGATGSLLCVPSDNEPRRSSLPGYMDGKNHISDSTERLLSRRRSSVYPLNTLTEVNRAGARKMKLFGLFMIVFLALVIGVSFLRLIH